MKALTEKEVRIGNYAYGLFEDENGKPARNIVSFLAVDSTSSLGDGWWAIAERIEGTETEEYDDFEPIPLTEEWLIKFGFKRESLEPSKEHSSYFSMWIMDYKYSFSYAPFREDWGFYHSYTDAGDDKDNNRFDFISCGIKYVHQLQNLYFALTGEELTIKETVPA